MQEKFFKTFVGDQFELEREIERWLNKYGYKEVHRSAPALTVNGKVSVVAVTVTAESNLHGINGEIVKGFIDCN